MPFDGRPTAPGLGVRIGGAGCRGGSSFYVTELATAGRYAYAVGGTREAARLIGVRAGRVSVWVLLASSLMATVAGVVLAAELGASTPTSGRRTCCRCARRCCSAPHR